MFLFPTNQSSMFLFPTNQSSMFLFPTNQSSMFLFPTNQSSMFLFPVISGISHLQAEAAEWLKDIQYLTMDDSMHLNVRAKEKEILVAREMSALAVYFQSVKFDEALTFARGGMHNQICSLTESRIERLMSQHPQKLLQYNRNGFTRVYPKGTRYD